MREAALAKAAKLGCAPYEALLDEYEPGMRMAEIDRLFADLSFLPALREAVLATAGKTAGADPAPGAVSDRRPGERSAAGSWASSDFDFDHGRFDVSPSSVLRRRAGRCAHHHALREDDFVSALMGTLHETGHAMYERGRPAAWRYQPVGASRGMALHESQSLLVEMQVCRSPEFLGFLAPLLHEAFGGEGGPSRRRISAASTRGSSPASSASMPTRSPIPATSSCAIGWRRR